MTTVQFSHFSTEKLSPAEQFEVWATSIGSIFDVAPPRPSSDQPFQARLDSCLVGEQLMLTRCQTHGQQFTRNPLRVAQDDMDHYVIQTHLSGQQTLQRGSRMITSRPGDLHIIDLTETHQAEASDFTNLSLVVPRTLLAPLLHFADDQHGRVLSAQHGLTRLAVQHLRTMADTMHVLTPDEALQTIEPTLLLLASAINGNPDALRDASESASTSILSRAKLLIERNLSGKLTVDWLCQQLPVSRASLYRLFESQGGIRHYIQDRRLRRAAQTLLSPQSRRLRICDIALLWGFSSESHFARAFRQKFGSSPSEARAMLGEIRQTPQILQAPVGDRDYERWLHETLR